MDASSDRGVRLYYMDRKVSKTFAEVPTPKSSDIEKLLYISQKGTKGIGDIYGTKILNGARDRFLASYGLEKAYRTGLQEGVDKDLSGKIDKRIKDAASLEYNKLSIRKKGLKI